MSRKRWAWPLATTWLLTASLVAGCSSDDSPSTPTPPPATVTLTAPTPDSPVNDAQLSTLRPELKVRNGTSTTAGTRTYEFQITDQNGGGTILAQQAGIPEGAGTTSFTPTADLQPATRLYWRARMTQGTTTSDWSTSGQFRTKVVGFNRPGELFDPLIHDETIGTRFGATTFVGASGLRIEDPNSWVRYQLASTLTSGEISVEVEGLYPNNIGGKSRIFSMMDGGSNLFFSKYLFNVQYRGVQGNPDNAISYKLLFGDEDFKYEPDFGARQSGVRQLNPSSTYLWTATWGSSFRLTIRDLSNNGNVIYDRSESTPGGVYNPAPHTAYLGANDAAQESGSFPRAVYRNLWVGNRSRPASLGSALHAPR